MEAIFVNTLLNRERLFFFFFQLREQRDHLLLCYEDKFVHFIQRSEWKIQWN